MSQQRIADRMQTHTIASRLRACLGLKLALLVVLNAWVMLPYFFLQHRPFHEVGLMQPGWLDHWIPFSANAVWLYVSVYLLMPIGPFLMNERGQIWRYAIGVALMGSLAALIFFFWPTMCARPQIESANFLYRWLIAIDKPLHAFPSLHAAFAVYSALCARLVLRELKIPRFCQALIWLWMLGILYSTLATRQHVTLDIIAGSVLGWAAYAAAFVPRRAWLPGRAFQLVRTTST